MAKMLASSLTRTYFGGDVIVFRNSHQPLFFTQRQGIEEIFIEVPEAEELSQCGALSTKRIGRPWLGKHAECRMRNSAFSRVGWHVPPSGFGGAGVSPEGGPLGVLDLAEATREGRPQADRPPFDDALAGDRRATAVSKPEWSNAHADALARVAMSLKYRVRHHIDACRYGWVMFIDADCLALRNLDHLLPNTKCGVRKRSDAETGEANEEFSDGGETGARPRGRRSPADYGPPVPGLFEESDADILYQPEPGRSAGQEAFSAYAEARGGVSAPEADGSDDFYSSPQKSTLRGDGINSGTWAVRGEHYQAVMEAWEAIEATPPRLMTQWTEQGAWNCLIAQCRKKGGEGVPPNRESLTSPVGSLTRPVSAGDLLARKALGPLSSWRARAFEAGEVQFPLHLDRDWKRYKEAALLHAVGGTTKEKIEFLFGMFMQRFYGDPATTLVNILET